MAWTSSSDAPNIICESLIVYGQNYASKSKLLMDGWDIIIMAKGSDVYGPPFDPSALLLSDALLFIVGPCEMSIHQQIVTKSDLRLVPPPRLVD